MRSRIFLLFLFVPLIFLAVPYKTYTLGVGFRFVETQHAFVPSNILELNLLVPEDIFFDKQTGTLLIADTGNSRIVLLNSDQSVDYIGEDYLWNPTGVFALNGKVYVADSMNKSVVVYSYSGELINEITKPNSPMYGKNDFTPKKIAADYKGNIYVSCLGLTEGLAVFNERGEFLGFTGANKPNISLKMILQRIFFSERQKEQLLKVRAPSPTNVFVDTNGLVYTVTQGLKNGGVKKFNIIGENIFPEIATNPNFSDLCVDEDGNVYALSSQGTIDIISSDGNLVFSFGGQSYIEERLGLTRNSQGIALDDRGNLYVLDKETGRITVFSITNFGRTVLNALSLYNSGKYRASKNFWEDILKMNEQFLLAYRTLGNIYFKEQDYSKAFKYFSVSQDRQGYSDAFWQLRNDWLQKNSGRLIIWIFLIYITFEILKKYLSSSTKEFFKEISKRLKRTRILSEFFYAWRVFKHPIDTMEDVHRYGRGDVRSALILFVLIFIVNFASVYIQSPIFGTFQLENINILDIFINSYLLLFIWMIGNYLVSEIGDGEGTFAKIFIGSMYALTPYITFRVPIALLSRVLTLNEAFIYDFLTLVISVWIGILFFIKVNRIHNFKFKETVRNILLTIFAGLLLSILAFVLYTLFIEELNFVISVFGELILRGKV